MVKMNVKDFTPISIPLGRDMGCALTDSSATHAVMVEDQLRALDLRDCPNLQTIDLRASTQHEIHLSVVGCPRLNEIFLPESSNSYIHIDWGTHEPVVQVWGGVAHIDTAWVGNRFEITKHKDQPWSYALIGSLKSLLSHQNTCRKNGLWVVSQPSDDQVLDLTVPDDVDSVLLTSFKKLEKLKITSSEPSSLDIRYCPKLGHLEAQGFYDSIVVTNSPSLAKISAVGTQSHVVQLKLHDSSGGTYALSIDLPADEIVIAGSGLSRLKITHETLLSLIGCYSLIDIDIPAESGVECVGFTPPRLIGVASSVFDEGVIKHGLEQIEAKQKDAWLVLRSQIPLGYAKDNVAKVLKGLRQALEVGISIEEVWEARMMLYARHKAPPKRQTKALLHQDLLRGLQEWNWTMATDLKIDGWRADFEIWGQAFEANIKGTRKMLPVMADGIVKKSDAGDMLLPHISCNLKPYEISLINAVIRRAFDNNALRRQTLSASVGQMLFACSQLKCEQEMLSDLARSAKDALCAALPLDDLLRVLQEWLKTDFVDAQTRALKLMTSPPDHGGHEMSTQEFQKLVTVLLMGGQIDIQPKPRQRSVRVSP